MNTTVAGLSLFSASQQQYLATERPFYYVSSSSVFESLADNYMSLAAPVIAYWTASLFFHILDLSDARWLDKYRIHESAEVKSRNLATRWDVFIAVIFQHVVQTLVGYFWMEDKPAGDAIDHLAALAGRAPFLLNLLRVVLGSKLAVQLWADYGHQLAYTVYWWAIPAAKFLLGMYVLL